jgi:hypothetical protein
MAAASDLDAGVREYLSQASDEVIDCRALGHGWKRTHDGYIVEGRGPDRVYTQRVRCPDCGTNGTDTFDPVTLDRIGTRKYEYPDGYLLEDHQGALSRREVRQWIAAKARARSAKAGRRSGKTRSTPAGGRQLRRAS